METAQEIAENIKKINNMSQIEMARLWRFGARDNKYFDSTGPYADIFQKRFSELGGFTPAISKQIGWG